MRWRLVSCVLIGMAFGIAVPGWRGLVAAALMILAIIAREAGDRG